MTKESPRFDPSLSPEFTIARLMGDELPTPEEFATSFTKSELYDMVRSTEKSVLDLESRMIKLQAEINRLKRIKQLVASALPLSLEQNIE